MADRLPDASRTELLRYAREVLAATVLGREPPPEPAHPAFEEPAAAFVTLRRDHTLRGCIGDTSFSSALGHVVGRMTRAAATADPRFPPVGAEELADITIEVSVLSPFRRADPGAVVPGRHGIVVSLGSRRGLLLPQVADQCGAGRARFLALALEKAGLPDTAPDDPEFVLEIFEAEVFAE